MITSLTQLSALEIADQALREGLIAYDRRHGWRGPYARIADVKEGSGWEDVFARLLTFPNVIVTAHQAFLTREALGDIARVTVANLQAFADNRPFVEGTVLC